MYGFIVISPSLFRRVPQMNGCLVHIIDLFITLQMPEPRHEVLLLMSNLIRTFYLVDIVKVHDLVFDSIVDVVHP